MLILSLLPYNVMLHYPSVKQLFIVNLQLMFIILFKWLMTIA